MSSTKTIVSELRFKHQIYWLVGVLVFIAICSIILRSLVFSPDKLAGDDQLWRLNIQISTAASEEPTSIKINPPYDTSYIRTIERNISHPGFKIKNISAEKNARRSIAAQAIKTGPLQISANFLLHQSKTSFTAANIQKKPLTTEQRETYLTDGANFEIYSYVVQQKLKAIIETQPQQNLLLSAIYNYLKAISISNKKSVYNVSRILTLKKATDLDKSIAMVALSRAAGIPSRLVSGLILKKDQQVQPHYWVQAYEDDQWNDYDIHYGYEKTVPENYLPLRRNSTDIIETVKGSLKNIRYDLTTELNHPFLKDSQDKNFINIFDFTRLSIDERSQLALLLLLPLGALITTLFRHLIGINSYGVFTPTLIALAIVYTDLVATLVIFIVVSTLAIGGRSFFPSSITRTPRLSIIFTLIAVISAFSVSVLTYFDLAQGDSVILLPIIILTSLVDRFYRTIEDSGMSIAMHRMVWTIIITLCCLPVIQFERLGHLILQYPESHFITLALFLLISTYKGKFFINLPIVKVLAEPASKKKKKAKATDE